MTHQTATSIAWPSSSQLPENSCEGFAISPQSNRTSLNDSNDLAASPRQTTTSIASAPTETHTSNTSNGGNSTINHTNLPFKASSSSASGSASTGAHRHRSVSVLPPVALDPEELIQCQYCLMTLRARGLHGHIRRDHRPRPKLRVRSPRRTNSDTTTPTATITSTPLTATGNIYPSNSSTTSSLVSNVNPERPVPTPKTSKKCHDPASPHFWGNMPAYLQWTGAACYPTIGAHYAEMREVQLLRVAANQRCRANTRHHPYPAQPKPPAPPSTELDS